MHASKQRIVFILLLIAALLSAFLNSYIAKQYNSLSVSTLNRSYDSNDHDDGEEARLMRAFFDKSITVSEEEITGSIKYIADIKDSSRSKRDHGAGQDEGSINKALMDLVQDYGLSKGEEQDSSRGMDHTLMPWFESFVKNDSLASMRRNRENFVNTNSLKDLSKRSMYQKKYTWRYSYPRCRWGHLTQKLLTRESANERVDLSVGFIGGSNTWYDDFNWRYVPQLKAMFEGIVKEFGNGGTVKFSNLGMGGYSSCTFALQARAKVINSMRNADVVFIETAINDVVHFYDQDPVTKTGYEYVKKCTEFVVRTVWEVAPKAVIFMIGFTHFYRYDDPFVTRPVAEDYDIPVFTFREYLDDNPRLLNYTPNGVPKEIKHGKDPEFLPVAVDDVHVGPFGASILKDWVAGVLIRGMALNSLDINPDEQIRKCELETPRHYNDDDVRHFTSSVVTFDREDIMRKLYDPDSKGCTDSKYNVAVKNDMDHYCIGCPRPTRDFSKVLKKREDPTATKDFIDGGAITLVQGGWIGCYDIHKCHPMGFLFNNDVLPSQGYENGPEVIGKGCMLTLRIRNAQVHISNGFRRHQEEPGNRNKKTCRESENGSQCAKRARFSVSISHIMSYDRMGMFKVFVEAVPAGRISAMMSATHDPEKARLHDEILLVDGTVIDSLWKNPATKLSVPQSSILPFDEKELGRLWKGNRTYDMLVHIEPLPISHAIQARKSTSTLAQQNLGNKIQIVELGIHLYRS